ncbi:uncharacterized protein LOC105697435 [Orussus abietinus]|uniref:uncharacterized protein LOC105697435 n=1 Tax=Orussus abietinus TaxID=222816 RepID=UPI000624F7B9|nr:uncharacterized protein LOC105697435 [Orussus abietinus]XP_012276178.1 uncharacterized protein LOC105697435 [Orussus abietinus]XP_012276179.1 uncharacterized protein LOC105697435 [Orussus abietinus]
MQDLELAELEAVKLKLIKKVETLRDKLKEQEENGVGKILSLERFLLEIDETETDSPKTSWRDQSKLCEASRRIFGITFNDIEKKWLKNNEYLYTARVITKAIKFFLDLKVDLKNKPHFEVTDITCHFVEVNRCYMTEIGPWVQRFTRMNNFPFLMSAISDYSEQNAIRARILQKCQEKNYVSLEESTDIEGGIVAHVHSTKDKKRIYLKLHWYLKFFDNTWRIEHFFSIEPKEPVDFAESNKELLNSFCQPCLRKNQLEQVWNKLCVELDTWDQANSISQQGSV